MKGEMWLTDEIEVTVSGVFTTHHLLQTTDGILGELTLPGLRMRGVFRRVFDLHFDDQMHTLRTAGFWGRVWYLVDGAGMTLLEVCPRGAFRRGAHLAVQGR